MKEDKADLTVSAPTKLEEKAPAVSENKPFFVEADKMFDRLADLSRETAKKAFEFFVDRGGYFGREIDDWFRAENEILRPVAVEITEANGTVSVRADIAGFKPEEVEISVKDDTLIISGETETHSESKKENVVYSEFKSNRFFRKLALPTTVDPDKAKAEMKDGVLKISLPKVEIANEPKHIAVTAG